MTYSGGFKDYEIDVDPSTHEDDGLDVDQGADPNEGRTEQENEEDDD